MTDNVILKEIDGYVAVLTLNRPNEMNALNCELMVAIRHEIEACDREQEIRAVVLTGAGERAFCAGVDLKERAAMTEQEVMESRRVAVKPCYDIFRVISTPVIAAVNGVAMGGGAELALACDIRLATPNARFAHPEIRWGMIPAAGAHQRLRNLVSLGVAKEIMLTGRSLEADEAHRLGIYNHIYESQRLLPEALAMARVIAAHHPLAVRKSKRVLDDWAYSDAAFEAEYEASKACYQEGGALAGPKSFKRDGKTS
ncbi:MAG: enoyl-CoA hydratase/isomerase family protein [Pseudorhodoplanes sp.]|nr:MAG: enoyl-CoA hydratase/isomerase family protein [Pseudorhodoplanes sp.]